MVIKSGGRTRLASVFHSLALILSMFLLGGVMGRIPLSALAGVLMVTAWRMNDWATIRSLFSKRLRHSILQFVITMAATVVFDLAVAIVVGIGVAMLLFVLKSCDLKIALSDIREQEVDGQEGDHQDMKVVYLTGPLFFGTQEQLTAALAEVKSARAVIFSMRAVPYVDDSAIAELRDLLESYRAQGTAVLFSGVQPAVRSAMSRAGFVELAGEENFVWDTIAAIKKLDADLAIIDQPLAVE